MDSIFPIGSWVKCKHNDEIRYVTKHNNEKRFEDDGKLSNQPPSPHCYYKYYTLIDGNLKIILDKFSKHRGEFVITDSWKIERLIAIGDDEFDYYYITYDGRKLTWNTCVGRIIPLKGKIEHNDYMNFIRIAELNHYDQEKLWNIRITEEKQEAINQHKKELTSLKPPNKFLTEVCWDLN